MNQIRDIATVETGLFTFDPQYVYIILFATATKKHQTHI